MGELLDRQRNRSVATRHHNTLGPRLHQPPDSRYHLLRRFRPHDVGFNTQFRADLPKLIGVGFHVQSAGPGIEQNGRRAHFRSDPQAWRRISPTGIRFSCLWAIPLSETSADIDKSAI